MVFNLLKNSFKNIFTHKDSLDQTNKQLKSSLKDLSVLYQVSQILARPLEFEEFLEDVSQVITKNLSIKEFSLLFFDPAHRYLEVRLASGFKDNARIRGMMFKLGEGISGRVAESGQMIYVSDTKNDPHYLHYKGEKLEDGSFLSLPLKVGSEVVGVLNLSHRQKNAFSETDISSLQSVSNQIATGYERSRLYTRIKELSVTDELTRLYNRRYFQQVLQAEFKRARRFKRPLSLILIDVDYFKKFNDQEGHLKGDERLKQLSELLLQNIREVDTLARFGGEEFVILLPDTSLEAATGVAEKLRTLVAKEGSSFSSLLPLTISAGVSTLQDSIVNIEDLIDQADQALYQAKKEGRNRVCIAQS